MAHDVFISYASGDKPVADAACAALEAKGIRCWIAPRDVLPGIHYGEAIIDAIHECRIMVLVFSAKANLSGHIPKEIERAVSCGATVMPMRIEDVAPAKSLDYFIGSVHWLDALTPPMEVHLQRLAANVQTLLSRSTPLPPRLEGALPVPHPEETAAGHSATAPVRPLWTYVAIGGLTALVLVLGFLAFRSRSHMGSTLLQPVASVPASPAVAIAAPIAVDPKKALVSATQPAKAAASLPAKAIPATGPPVGILEPRSRQVALHYVPASSIKLEQLIGQEDKEKHQPTPSRTFQRYQIRGAELGSSFDHDGHAYFLFGDTMGRLGRAASTIATSDASDPESGVQLSFMTVGDQYLAIEPSGVTMGVFDVPVAGISLGGQMYVAVSTNFSKDHTTDRSILTKFSPPSTFQALRTISERPAGRFIRMSMHAEPGPIAGLPAGGPFVLTWGTGKYRDDDAYLSIVPSAQFESGKGARYFSGLNPSGAPLWSDNESDATPILKEGTIGDMSVTWCKELGLWLMTYDRRSPLVGIAFSYSRTPWGSWSEPQLIFNVVREGAYGKFIHNPQAQPDDGLEGPVFGPRNQTKPGEVRGGAYAPYVVERWTKVQGSELDLYYVLSTYNPYVVVLMKSRLSIEK